MYKKTDNHKDKIKWIKLPYFAPRTLHIVTSENYFHHFCRNNQKENRKVQKKLKQPLRHKSRIEYEILWNVINKQQKTTLPLTIVNH